MKMPSVGRQWFRVIVCVDVGRGKNCIIASVAITLFWIVFCF